VDLGLYSLAADTHAVSTQQRLLAVQAWTIVARSTCPLIMHNSLTSTVPWGLVMNAHECNELLVCSVQPDAVSLCVVLADGIDATA